MKELAVGAAGFVSSSLASGGLIASGLEGEGLTLFAIAAAVSGSLTVAVWKAWTSRSVPVGIVYFILGAMSGVFVGSNGAALITNIIPNTASLTVGGATYLFSMVAPFFVLKLFKKLDGGADANDP